MKYPKTRQALAVYDAWKSHVWDNARSEDIDVVLAEEERFGRAVGRAFGEVVDPGTALDAECTRVARRDAVLGRRRQGDTERAGLRELISERRRVAVGTRDLVGAVVGEDQDAEVGAGLTGLHWKSGERRVGLEPEQVLTLRELDLAELRFDP